MKKILFLLMLPFAAMAQNKVQEYQHDSTFTYNVDSNYVDITPVQFQRGDNTPTDRITILSVIDYGTTAVVEFKLGDYSLTLSVHEDYNGYVLYDWKYLFWRIADVYSLNIK
jgi:hypothetical protein